MNRFLAVQFNKLHERLLGRKTFSIYVQLLSSQFWPIQRMRELQSSRMRQLVEVAYTHCPYWRDIMNSRGIKPQDIRNPEDLWQFPLLDKDTIRANREQMVWRSAGRGVKLARTTGSTNAALEFYTSATREAHISAARMRGHLSAGIRPGDKEVYFWRAPVELDAQGRIKQLRDTLRNDAFTNALLISPEAIRQNLRRWMAWRPTCIFGYASSLSLTAGMAMQEGIDLTQLRRRGLRAIVTTSELLGERREVIRRGFGVPVYDSYGLREGGLVGHECSHMTMHTNDEQLILETIDPTTGQTTDGEGELVLTMLMSQAMPIIRYRTGDVVKLSSRPCACGRTLGSLSISGGRLLEFLVTSDGRWVGGMSMMHVCHSVKGLRQIQARQQKLGQIKLLLAWEQGCRPADGPQQVISAVRDRVGPAEELIVEEVDEIPPAASGKQRMVISEVAAHMLGRQSSIMTAAAQEAA